MDYDPVPDIRKLGYTMREARFLSLVGTYGGYFLRRQFIRYVRRTHGGVDQSLVEKGQRWGHLRALDYGGRRQVFQLTSTAICYLLGRRLPFARRPKGDLEIKSRLLVLDYIVDHVETRFLASSDDKLDYFSEVLNIACDFLPRRPRIEPGCKDAAVYFDELSPIALLPGVAPAPLLVSIVFVDGGNQTDLAFRSFLARYQPLCERLDRFEVVYVSDSRRNFAPAAALFHHAFRGVSRPLFAQGASHFLDYLRVRSSEEDDPQSLDPKQRELLGEGKELYASARHEQIYAAWKQGKTTFAGILATGSSEACPGSIRGYLMQASYPSCLPRLGRAS